MKKNVTIGIPAFVLMILLIIFLGASTFFALQKVKSLTCRASRSETGIAVLQDSLHRMNDSLQVLNDSLYGAQLFSLTNNDEALDYLEKYYGRRADWYAYVQDKLLDQSRANPDGFFPYAAIYGPWAISNIRIINHKWLIISITDGRQWGEMLMEYEPVGHDSISFNRMRSLLYPPVQSH